MDVCVSSVVCTYTYTFVHTVHTHNRVHERIGIHALICIRGRGRQACMYVCMYVCMHVCLYVWMYVCMYVCMFVCICVVVCVCVFVCMHACMHVCVRTFTNMHGCTHVAMHASRLVRILHAHMYTCTHVCIQKAGTLYPCSISGETVATRPSRRLLPLARPRGEAGFPEAGP